MMHGNDWMGQDVAGWWASEKFDGWRARWTGTKLLSRMGRDYNAGDYFTNHLPKLELDCEIWAGYGKNHNDVNRLISAGRWSELSLINFDVVGVRIEMAIEILKLIHGSAFFWKVESTSHAKARMKEIIDRGGEGIMLRWPESDYVHHRTNDLLKMKP